MTEVGQISIRVKPDTDLFREELNAELEAIEEGLSVKVKADPNTAGFREKVAAGTSNLKDAVVNVKADTRELDLLNARLRALADNNSRRINFSNLLEMQRGGLGPGEGQTVRVKLAWANLAQAQAELKAAVSNETLDLKLKTSKWDYIKAEFRILLAQLQGIAQFNPVEVNTEMSRASTVKARLRLLLSELQGIARANPIKVNVDVDRNRLQQAFSGLGSKIGGGVSAIGRLAGSAADAVPRLFSFSTIIMVCVAAVLLLIPPVLALSAGIISLAPAFLALLAPIGAIALGMDGIKKAAENAGLFSDTNGDQQGGGSIGAALDAIKQKVSDTFENGLQAAFNGIRDAVNDPRLSQSLVGLADGISKVGSGFINALTKGQGFNDLNTIIANVGKGFEAAAPGVEKFTQGILRLVAGISEKFPGLGQWITDLGNKFANAMTEWTTIPQDNGMTKLENLINNVRTGIEGLTGVFQAFWNQGLKDIQDPNFGQGMMDFFSGIKEFVTNTLPTLTEGFKQFAAFLDAISPAFKAIGAVTNGVGLIGDFISGVFGGDPGGETFDNMVSRIEESAAKGGSIGDQIAAGLFQLGPASEKGFGAVAANGQKAAADVKAAMTNPAPATGINGKGAPGQQPLTLEELTAAVAGDLAKANEAGQQIGGEVNKGIQQGVNQPAAQLAPGLSTQVQGAVQQAQQDIATIGPVLQQTVTAAMAPLQSLPAVITPAITGVIQVITAGFSGIPAVISASMTGVIQVVAAGFSGIPGIVTNALTGVVQIAATTFGALPQIASNGFTGMATAATNAGTQIVESVTTAGTTIVTEVGSWPERLVSAMGDLSGKFSALGQQVGSGLAAGINAGAGAAIAAASKLAADVEAASKGALGIRSPSKVFTEIGEFVGQGLANGMENQSENVISTIRQILEQIKAVFGDNANLNLTLNLGGVQQQAQSATTAVKDFGTAVASVPSTPLTDPSMGTPSADMLAQSKELGRQLELLEMQRKRVELAKDAGTISKEAAKAELEKINNQKTSLGLQKNELDYAKKYGAQTEETKGKLSQMYEQIGKAVVGLPTDFAKNVGGQFMNDLGMSGDGAIPSALTAGANYIFQVADMTSALTAQQTLQNRQALQYN